MGASDEASPQPVGPLVHRRGQPPPVIQGGAEIVLEDGTRLRVISPSKGTGDRMLAPDVHVSFQPADCLVLST